MDKLNTQYPVPQRAGSRMAGEYPISNRTAKDSISNIPSSNAGEYTIFKVKTLLLPFFYWISGIIRFIFPIWADEP